MLFLLFCFLLFIGFLVSFILRVIFAWLKIKKHHTPTQPTRQPDKQRKKFDSTDAEDVEYEEIEE